MAHLLNLFKKVPTSTWLPFLCQNFMLDEWTGMNENENSIENSEGNETDSRCMYSVACILASKFLSNAKFSDWS